MKNVFFVFFGIFLAAGSAHAGNQSCTRDVCDDFSNGPAPKQIQQEAWRDIMTEAEHDKLTKQHMSHPSLDNGSIDSGLASNPESIFEGRN